MDRRAIFFLGAAVVCALLAPVTDSDLRWVPVALAITYSLLAIASLLDFRSRRASFPERTPEPAAPPRERVLTDVSR